MSRAKRSDNTPPPPTAPAAWQGAFAIEAPEPPSPLAGIEANRRAVAKHRAGRYAAAEAELAAYQAEHPARDAVAWCAREFATPYVPKWAMPKFMADVLRVCLDAPAELNAISLRKAAQLGYTTMLASLTAWCAARGRKHVAILQPTDADAVSWRRESIGPLFENIEELALLAATAKHNPEAVRVYKHSSVRVIGGTSPRNYRRWVANMVCLDERDALVETAGGDELGEGDPVVLAQRAMANMEGGGRLVVGGTPTGESRIMREAEGAALAMVYMVRCPECGAFDALEFERIRAEKGWQEPLHVCSHCGGMWPWAKLAKAVRQGRWAECEHGDQFPLPMAEGRWLDTSRRKPIVRTIDGKPCQWPRSVGFNIDGCYSVWRPWQRLLGLWFDVAASGDPHKLQAFTEQHLSRRFRRAGHSLSARSLREKATPAKGAPSWAESVVMGVDVQQTHLSVLAVAFGRPSRGLVLERREFHGSPIEAPGEGCWREMGLWLRDTWTGKGLPPRAMAVDVGFEQTACLAALRSLRRQGLLFTNTFAVKGFDGADRPAWRWTKTATGDRMAAVGQTTVLLWALPLLERGTIRVSDGLGEDVLEELCALALRQGKVRGRRGLKVVQVGPRAEAADALVYAAAWWLAATGGARVVADAA